MCKPWFSDQLPLLTSTGQLTDGLYGAMTHRTHLLMLNLVKSGKCVGPIVSFGVIMESGVSVDIRFLSRNMSPHVVRDTSELEWLRVSLGQCNDQADCVYPMDFHTHHREDRCVTANVHVDRWGRPTASIRVCSPVSL